MAKRIRYLGFKEESEYAETPLPDAEMVVDIASASLDTPSDTQMLYAGGLTRGHRIHRPGFYAPSGGVEFAWDVHTIGWFLKWALGGYRFTADGGSVSDMNLHEIYASEDAKMQTFCARLGKDVFEHIFSGCAINSMSLNTEGEYCLLSADITAAKDAKGAIQTMDAIADLLPVAYPLAFHELTVKIGTGVDGTDISARVKSINLEIGNNIGADAGRSVGSRYPRRAIAGARDITFAMNYYYEEMSMLEKLWGASTGPSATGSTEYDLELLFDGGDYGKLIIVLPKVINAQVQQQPSGRDEIVQAITGRAIIGTAKFKDGDEVSTDIFCSLENTQENMGAEETPEES